MTKILPYVFLILFFVGFIYGGYQIVHLISQLLLKKKNKQLNELLRGSDTSPGVQVPTSAGNLDLNSIFQAGLNFVNNQNDNSDDDYDE